MSGKLRETIHYASPIHSKRRLWKWFAAGFTVAFFGIAAVYPMYAYDGWAVHRTVLWRYYVLEIQRQLGSSGAIGLTSGSSAGAITVLAEHILLSVVAGALALVIGRFLRSARAG